MSLPKVGTVTTEKIGVAEVYRATFRRREQGGLGFVFRELHSPDAGVDALIEVLDLERQEFTGRFVGVQVKGGGSWFDHPTDDGWAVYIGKPTVEYWENYSVPVILTLVDVDAGNIYWAVVSQGEHEEKETKYRITVPSSQRLDATSADAIADLAMRASQSLAAKLEALSNDLTENLAAELDRNRNAWREGRRTEARQWVQALAEFPERLKETDANVGARVLRWAAGTILDEYGDLDIVRRLMEEARGLDPESDDLRLRAFLAAHTESAQAALDLLGDSQIASTQLAKAAILLQLGRHDEVRSILAACSPESDYEKADLHRFKAQIGVADGDLDGAADELREAKSFRANDVWVRLLEAQLMYWRGLPAPVRAGPIPPWPQPIPQEVRAASEEARGQFRQAAEALHLLLQLDSSENERRRVEAWRIAALCLASESKAEASAFAEQVLRDDPAHPFVLLWATTDLPLIDVAAHLQYLEEEVQRTEDIGMAMVYLAIRANVDQTDGLAEWLDDWKDRFVEAGAGKEWAFWRARVFLMDEDVDGAGALLPDAGPERQAIIKAGVLRVEADAHGDDTDLITHLESAYRDSRDLHWLLALCELHAKRGRWAEVVPHLPALLQELPTPFVLRLAVFARYHTRDLQGFLELIERVLEAPPGEGVDVREYLRLRAVVRRMAGDVLGAVQDLEAVITQSEGPPPAEDLMAMVQTRAVAGQSHEMVAVARQLKARPDLDSTEALMLAEMVVGDDPALALDFWRIAEARDIPDENVARSMALGYRLGLDREMGRLHQRMVELAHAGHPTVRVQKIDEVIELLQDQAKQHDRVLELYRRGGTATHLVAHFLKQPLAHFYHFLPGAHEDQTSLRHRFPIQLRSGTRGFPTPVTEVAAPGKLALDLSALLLAAHLELLDAVEAHFGPVFVPSLTIPALREQREKLKPRQPSRIKVAQDIVRAERQGRLSVWEGDLPLLPTEERSAAGNWWQWVALLEKARLEDAFVLDLPLVNDSEQSHPLEVAGEARLDRIVTAAEMQKVLFSLGEIPLNNTVPGEGVPLAEPQEAGAPGGEVARRLPSRGAVIYMTTGGVEALTSQGLLQVAADVFRLRLDPEDQDARRTLVESIPDLQAQTDWIDRLARRVSDGLADGRYALLPTQKTPFDSEESSDEGEKGPPASMALRSLAEIVIQPANTLDAVWIEDRWLGRHRLAGTTRIVDGLEVMSALQVAGQLTDRDRYQRLLQMRAGNIRVIPFDAVEILYYLRAAAISNGRVLETRPLRVLRQYAAAVVEDADRLSIPDLDGLRRGEVGELDVLRALDTAVRDALIELWRGEAGEPGPADRSEAMARSAWIIENLYVEPALMRSRASPVGAGADVGLSALSVAGLLLSASQLVRTDSTLTSEEETGVARAFSQWAYDFVVAKRLKRNDRFRDSLVEQLARILSERTSHAEGDQITTATALLLSNRAFELLPTELQDALADQPGFMATIGRAVVTSLPIDQWDLEIGEFAAAAAALFESSVGGREPMPVRVAVLPSPKVASPPEFEMILAGSGGFNLTSPETGESHHLNDPAFLVLAPEGPARRMAFENLRGQVDLSHYEWQALASALLRVTDPGGRLRQIMAHRERTLRRRYTEMVERWRETGRIGIEDLKGNDPETVRRHLRIDAKWFEDETDSDLAPTALNEAAAVLVAEEGIEVAFSRFAGLPVRLPQSLLDALGMLDAPARQELIRKLLRRSGSPLSAVHLVRALSWLGRTEPQYLRLAGHLLRMWADPRLYADVEVLALVAQEAMTRQGGAATTLDLLGAWLHADRFIRAVRDTGGEPAELLSWLEGRRSHATDRLFDSDRNFEQDLGDPMLLTPARFAVASLQYVDHGTGLLPEGSDLIDAVAHWFTKTVEHVQLPHIDMLRGVRPRRDRVWTWLQPQREDDGRIFAGATEIIPSNWTPAALVARGLDVLEQEPFDQEPWVTLALVGRADAFDPAALKRFHAATDALELPALFTALEKIAIPVIGLLARNAQRPDDAFRRAALRHAFLAVQATEGYPGAETSTGPVDIPSTEGKGLTALQAAILEGCYLLSQAEKSSAAAMAVFAEDIRELGKNDVAYLERARLIVEELVRERSLEEAEQLVPLLLEARGL